MCTSVIQKFFFFVALFHFTHQWKRCNKEGFRPCHSQSQVVYAYHVISLLLQEFVWSKYHFWAYFGKTEMGVVIYMYLKHSPDYIDYKYIWVHGSNSLGSSVFAEIPFLAF